MLVLGGTSLIGGTFGAILLQHTSQTTFVRLVPYLLLVATLLFAFSGPITDRLRRHKAETDIVKARSSWVTLSGIALLQLIIAIYGGYFGGGIGILMLATLGLMGMENIHEMNALKTLLTSFINGAAVITFIIYRLVVWPQALLMLAGAIIGGYGGAYYARRLDPRLVRAFVIFVGIAMTIYFFVRG